MIKKDMFVSLETIEPDIEKCYAHLPVNGEKKETIVEHTRLCQKYFWRLVEEKNLNEVFDKFKNIYFSQVSDEAEELFDMLVVNVISFHDIGKINPLFQNKKMKNKWRQDIASDGNVGSKHSILSAVFYLDYFLERVKQAGNQEERKLLKDLVYIHSFLIAAHHGRLKEFEKYLESFEEEGNLGWHAKVWMEQWKQKIYHDKSAFTFRSREKGYILQRMGQGESIKQVYLYSYSRILYSLLVASDYYATSEFMNGVEIKEFGNIADYKGIVNQFARTEVMKSIREHEKASYPMSSEQLEMETNINCLRTELFLDAERELKKSAEQSLFYLEAPTGSGKSNTAINLSLQLLESGQGLKKIFYIYPFNTLVEQNMEVLGRVFGGYERTMAQIAVVNSLVPIKGSEEFYDTESQEKYQKLLLDRQFLNYPIILSTHVSLFNIVFGNGREDVFGFHQLCNSVIVLDEIQSYKVELWGEMIAFFKGMSRLLNIKIIIMSATLPNLEILADNQTGAVNLIKNRNKYFKHPVFAKRVVPNYEMLNKEITLDLLAEHVLGHLGTGKKILLEFIKKSSADEFYRILKEQAECEVLLMTGDSSIWERKKLIRTVENCKEVILVATQVIEAGVDIDFDIGYKDISRLDSEEQFMGRINRSCRRSGIVYFFNLDEAKVIYRRDIRTDEEFTLRNEDMREIVDTKQYDEYYNSILNVLKKRNEKADARNIKEFFSGSVGGLDFEVVKKRMQLIDDGMQMISIFFARVISDEEVGGMDGRVVWTEYKNLLGDENMGFAEKTIKLHKVRSNMNVFLYQFRKNAVFESDEQIGDIFYIENSEEYFDENGTLDRKRIENDDKLFF